MHLLTNYLRNNFWKRQEIFNSTRDVLCAVFAVIFLIVRSGPWSKYFKDTYSINGQHLAE